MKILKYIFLICLSLIFVLGADYYTYKQYMRDFVSEISNYARGIKPGFIVIPQNGIGILTRAGELSDPIDYNFLSKIDGWGIEDLFYGYDNDNVPSPTSSTNYLLNYLDLAKGSGKKLLVTDYCWTKSYMNNSYYKNFQKGYISFAADHRDLDNIPSFPIKPFNENSDNILNLNMAKNFLYLINPGKYATKSNFLDALKKTNYDVIIMDAFFSTNYSKSDIQSLKVKANLGKRLVISYMSIGEAENYRFYWKSGWKTDNPSFVLTENPNWQGNYKVKYWDPEWKKIIYGQNGSYLKFILDLDFDGVYLDIIDGYEFFEN